MINIIAKVATVATLALGLMGSTTEALGSAGTYNGTLCTGFVDYPIWLPPTQTVASIEGTLNAMGMNQSTLSQLPEMCFYPFLEYVCSSAFPRIVPTNTQNNEYNVMFTCKSTCQAAVQGCSKFFSYFKKPELIPNCDTPIVGTDRYTNGGIAYQPDGACNAITPSADAKPGGIQNLTATCNPPFITDPKPGGVTADPTYCMNGCCIPCPAQYYLYRTGALENGYRITNIIRAVSMVFGFILMVSYLFLDGKRSHPSRLILYFSICVFLFSAVIIFPLINTKEMQCYSEVTPNTQQNSMKCAIQGAILIFASVATCAWCTALILNLHLHTVWNSSWFAKKYWLLHLICWGYPAAVTGVALGMGEVKYEYATLCLVSQEKSSQIFFYPMAAFIFPAFLVHIATFIHIARISIMSSEDSETMSRSTLSAGAAAVISHRRHVMMAIRIQWRAALMAITAIFSVMMYWLFYFIQLKKINPAKLKDHVLDFVFCLSSGTPHDQCADELSPYLPPYGLMIAAEAVVSSIGAVIFIVFFKFETVVEWGEKFASIGYWMTGKGKTKKEQEQFFVI